MKARLFVIAILLLLCVACHTPTREARRMVKRAEQLADTLPDSTVRLIDSVLHMPVYFSERERMDMALLQAEALFGDRGTDLSPVMDDDFFDDHADLSTSPELERAAAYFAQKKQYAKAAHAALYSGFVQQHYDEKENAMRSFKEAEQYGGLAVDSLTVALAEYRMGKMLYNDYKNEEALSILKKSDAHLGSHNNIERAYVNNMEAVVYIVLKQLDEAEKSLEKSLYYAEQGQVNKITRKVLNNYAVLSRLQGKNDEAIAYLKQIKDIPDLSGSEKAMLFLNLGKVFIAQNHTDSAVYYCHCVEELLPTNLVKNETKASLYGSLSHLAEIQGDTVSAFLYLKKLEEPMSTIRSNIEKKSIYRIQQQYDYENLQNVMNRKLIRKQRLITFIGLLAIIGLAALAISQIRLAKIRKQEAEAKASLFHFMQQNKELVESNMEHEKKALDTTQQLSDLLHARLKAMQKLDYCLKTPKDKIALKDLEKEVFGEGDHWEAIKEVLVALYPGLWEALKLKYPDMDEMERRVFMLSYLKLSRLGEATLLGISTSVLDKLRTKVRKTMEQGQMP
jgi:tetratricopeptide (TPR) repeat protein